MIRQQLRWSDCCIELACLGAGGRTQPEIYYVLSQFISHDLLPFVVVVVNGERPQLIGELKQCALVATFTVFPRKWQIIG